MLNIIVSAVGIFHRGSAGMFDLPPPVPLNEWICL